MTVLSLIRRVITIPAIIAITAPPIIGNNFPKSHDGTAIAKHSNKPFQFFLINSIFFSFVIKIHKNTYNTFIQLNQ